MVVYRPVDSFGQGISRNTYDEDGFARARWTYDDDGFRKARVNALDAARSKLVNATHAENDKFIKENNPSAVARSVDGADDASDDAIKL